MKSKLLFLFYFSLSFTAYSQNFSIPSQQILVNEFLPNLVYSHDLKINVQSFEISKQITLKEYKEFLNEIKKDSGEAAYQSLLPDTTIGPKNIRDKYFNSGEFDDFPVVGISWDNALRYCKWLTVKNNSDSLKVIYRLPNLYEYFSAYSYLQKQAINNDLNNLYADWLMDTKDESNLDPENRSINLSYYYFHSKSDPNVLKRKIIMGKSFLHNFLTFENYMKLSYYANQGYREVGFRIVKVSEAEESNPLLQYWNLKITK